VAPGRDRRSVHRRRLIILSTDEIRMDFGNDGAGQKSGLWMLRYSLYWGLKDVELNFIYTLWVQLEIFIPVAFYVVQLK